MRIFQEKLPKTQILFPVWNNKGTEKYLLPPLDVRKHRLGATVQSLELHVARQILCIGGIQSESYASAIQVTYFGNSSFGKDS